MLASGSFSLLCIPEGDESLLLVPFNLMVIMLLLSVRTARGRESCKKKYCLGKTKLLFFPYVMLVIRKKKKKRMEMCFLTGSSFQVCSRNPVAPAYGFFWPRQLPEGQLFGNYPSESHRGALWTQGHTQRATLFLGVPKTAVQKQQN